MAESIIHGNTDTGWNDIGDTWANSIRKYRVKNGICYVSVATYTNSGSPSMTGGSWTRIGTLPIGARPTSTMYGSGANRSGSTAEIQITSEGGVFVNPSVTVQNMAFSMSFPV